MSSTQRGTSLRRARHVDQSPLTLILYLFRIKLLPSFDGLDSQEYQHHLAAPSMAVSTSQALLSLSGPPSSLS